MRRLLRRSVFRRLFATVACRRLLQLIRGANASSASVYFQSFVSFDTMKTRFKTFSPVVSDKRHLIGSDDYCFLNNVMM